MGLYLPLLGSARWDGQFYQPHVRPCWEREREEAVWRGQGVCGGGGMAAAGGARPGTKREGRNAWLGRSGCGKRRELGAPGWGLRGLVEGNWEPRKGCRPPRPLENQLSRPRSLLRVRWEGCGGSRGRENLLGRGRPWQFLGQCGPRCVL